MDVDVFDKEVSKVIRRCKNLSTSCEGKVFEADMIIKSLDHILYRILLQLTADGFLISRYIRRKITTTTNMECYYAIVPSLDDESWEKPREDASFFVTKEAKCKHVTNHLG